MPTTNPTWIDLLDPDEEALRRAWDDSLHPEAVDDLLEPTVHDDEPRPKLESHREYVLGVLLVPVIVADEDRVYYQEVDLLLSTTTVVTVRKTPPDGVPLDLGEVRAQAAKGGMGAGMVAYQVVDQVAEGFMTLIDGLQGEVDELEDHVEDWSNERVRRRLSELRHDLLYIRRTMAPTRDAIRRVVDNRIEIDSGDLFPHDVEIHFGDAYDKMLRSSEGLEAARDLVAGVRDYHQAKIANDQNDVMKRLAVLATVFLPLAFLTGFFGQNFAYLVNHVEIPEWTFWILGVGLEIAAAIGLFVLIKARRWL